MNSAAHYGMGEWCMGWAKIPCLFKFIVSLQIYFRLHSTPKHKYFLY